VLTSNMIYTFLRLVNTFSQIAEKNRKTPTQKRELKQKTRRLRTRFPHLLLLHHLQEK
jgi:hypothetical protein